MSRLSLILLFIVIFSTFVEAQTKRTSADLSVFRSPFRYVIVHNEVDPAISKDDEASRFVEVLLDGKSFSKENLIVLLKLISKRFPKPYILHINVFTSLEDLETPEERDQPKISGTDCSSCPEASDNAVFTRANKKSFFYIYKANGDFDQIEIK